MKKEVAIFTADEEPEVSAQPPQTDEGIRIDTEDAKRLIELYTSLEVADAHYHTCQAQNFRQFVQSVYKAPKITSAYRKLNACIESKEG